MASHDTTSSLEAKRQINLWRCVVIYITRWWKGQPHSTPSRDLGANVRLHLHVITVRNAATRSQMEIIRCDDHEDMGTWQQGSYQHAQTLLLDLHKPPCNIYDYQSPLKHQGLRRQYEQECTSRLKNSHVHVQLPNGADLL